LAINFLAIAGKLLTYKKIGRLSHANGIIAVISIRIPGYSLGQSVADPTVWFGTCASQSNLDALVRNNDPPGYSKELLASDNHPNHAYMHGRICSIIRWSILYCMVVFQIFDQFIESRDLHDFPACITLPALTVQRGWPFSLTPSGNHA